MERIKSLHRRLHALLDPNDWRVVSRDGIGLRYPPLANRNHARMGTRERVLDVVDKKHPLEVRLNALATNVILEKGPGGEQRAVGVRYLKGERLYDAHWNPSSEPGEPEEVRLKDGGEVIQHYWAA